MKLVNESISKGPTSQEKNYHFRRFLGPLLAIAKTQQETVEKNRGWLSNSFHDKTKGNSNKLRLTPYPSATRCCSSANAWLNGPNNGGIGLYTNKQTEASPIALT